MDQDHSAKKLQKWQKENVLKKTGQMINLYYKTMPNHQKKTNFPRAILQKSARKSEIKMAGKGLNCIR